MSLLDIIIKEEESIDLVGYFSSWSEIKFKNWIEDKTIHELKELKRILLKKELYELCCIIRDRLEEL